MVSGQVLGCLLPPVPTRGSADLAFPRHAEQIGLILKPVLLRIQETAKLLKVSKWTVYRWIEEGWLRATKIGQGSL